MWLRAIHRRVKYKNGTKFCSWISANPSFRNWAWHRRRSYKSYKGWGRGRYKKIYSCQGKATKANEKKSCSFNYKLTFKLQRTANECAAKRWIYKRPNRQKYTIISSSTPAINFLTVRGLAVLGERIEKAAEIQATVSSANLVWGFAFQFYKR